jgi:N-acetylglucosaminyldiphosphoundecaprenol N-acetyl-beta-D-mannosaminyltransferase
MNSLHILKVRIDKVSLDEARKKVSDFLRSSGQYKIFTPNPEFLVKAHSDEYFLDTLNKSDLNLCDGRGIQFVSKQKLQRITGVDFMLEICSIAQIENRSIYLLGSGRDEVVKKTAENLQKKFPNLKIAGWSRGEVIDENKILNNDVEQINRVAPDILFVAFGMGKQEKWITENLVKIPRVKIAMGVGGAFDYISGSVKRAPLLMRKIGLEWLYRLIKQPQRIVRIWNATFKFMYLIYKK